MSNDESLDWLRQVAREELDKILGADLLVSMPDGTKKLAIELTWKEISYLEPPELWVATFKCINRYKLAKNGKVVLGYDGVKHIDELTLEDAPGLGEAIEDRLERFEGVIEAADLRVGTIQQVFFRGDGAEPDKRVIDWGEPGPSKGTRRRHQTEED